MSKVYKDQTTSELSFARRLKDQLYVNGWSIIEKRADSTVAVDFVMSSPGSNPLRSPCFLRFVAASGTVSVYGYESYVSSTTYSGELFSSTTSTFSVPASFQYWTFTDSDHTKFVLRDTTSGQETHGYAGFIEGFHKTQEDPQPILVFTTSSGNASWEDGSSSVMLLEDSVQSYTGASLFSATYSGTSFGDFTVLAKVLLAVPNDEVRGSPIGVYRVSGPAPIDMGSITTLSGVFYTFTDSMGLSNSYAYGPVDNPTR